MATNTWKIEKDLCRCCHAEGTYDNLAEPRIFLEKEEIYSDMLREYLDIDISPVPGDLCAITYTICNTCITRLRDACNFKKQVQDCEERFMELYYKNSIKVLNSSLDTVVKVEPNAPIEDNHMEDDPTEDEIELKKEDSSQVDDDDHDFMLKDDEDDISDDDDDDVIKEVITSKKPKGRPKSKTEKKEKTKRSRKKIKQEKSNSAEKEKKDVLFKKGPLTADEKYCRYREKLRQKIEQNEEAKGKDRDHYHKVKKLAEDLTANERQQANLTWN